MQHVVRLTFFRCFAWIVVQLSVLQVFAQAPADSLSSTLDRMAREAGCPGFAAVIVGGGSIVYGHCGGFADVARKRPFSFSTIENIGSVSKTFVAVALMKAIELGYFSLQTPLSGILPFSVRNPYHPRDTIRVWHLVTHTSGIIDNDSIYKRSYRFENSDLTDTATRAFLQRAGYTGGLPDTTLAAFMAGYLVPGGNLYDPANFYDSRPGQRASYSNVGSALAAYLIEVKARMLFSAFAAKYILKPLRMQASGWTISEVDRGQLAVPYVDSVRPLPLYSLTTYPDGGLRTSAADLSLYVMEMIRSLRGAPVLLGAHAVQAMFAPFFSPGNLPLNMSLQTRNKGVFWNLYNDGYIGHDGDDPGVSTNIVFNRDVGIIFLTNVYLPDRSAFLQVLKRYAAEHFEHR